MLKTGGPECEMQVDCIIFQGGRRWIVPGQRQTKNAELHAAYIRPGL